MKDLHFITRSGSDIEECFPDLAELRIAVFHDYPYLYEGTLAYEKEYLKTYSDSPRSLLFAVYDGQKMVGATTCIPLIDETAEVQAPFLENGFDPDTIFYFGESILLKPYRGSGLGHKFFDVREAHAAAFGNFKMTCFCSVSRPDDHPSKPDDYRPNDTFWLKRGYAPHPGLTSFFEWIDIGHQHSTSKPMTYWTKSI